MARRWQRVLLAVAVVLLASTTLSVFVEQAAAFGQQTLWMGMRGGDVYELQGRLKLLGLYTGPVDGHFGRRTYLAVRRFQYEWGLRVDGVVGPRTKVKLWQATKHWYPGLEKLAGKPTIPILKVGSRGPRVRELQARLKFLGYDPGPIDGRYGWRTLRAVRTFQWRFGLPVDGIAGVRTQGKLWEATKRWRWGMEARVVPPRQVAPPAPPRAAAPAPPPARRPVQTSGFRGFSERDIDLMARAVHAEARGEPYVGKVAVAAVILNRIESGAFPNTPAGVIFEPLAFEAVADGQIWLPPDRESRRAVIDALNGWDPTGGALYYFNPERATSKWIWSRPQIKRIGKHIFAK